MCGVRGDRSGAGERRRAAHRRNHNSLCASCTRGAFGPRVYLIADGTLVQGGVVRRPDQHCAHRPALGDRSQRFPKLELGIIIKK